MVNIVRWDPFREMDQMFNQMNQLISGTSSTLVSAPVTDVFEEDGKLVVQSHLGGLNDKDINVTIDRGALVISGEHEEKEEHGKRNYMLRESSVSMYRRIMLPKDADTENIQAHMDNGVLRVEIPMLEKPEPKKIDIQKRK